MKKLYIIIGLVLAASLLFVYFMPGKEEPKTPTFPMPATLQTSAENSVVDTPIDYTENHKD